MPNFENLKKKLAVDASKTIPVDLGFITKDGEPAVILHVLPAGTTNKALHRAALEDAGNRPKARRAANLSPEQQVREFAEGMERDRVLYANHVVKGWENVFGDDGVAVPFSAKECEALLRALPDDLFGILQTVCNTPDNWRVVDGAAIAKN